MDFKRQAAAQALTLVRGGMILGLGTGSTTAYFIEMLGEKLKSGDLQGIIAVPTSERTAARARALNIPLATLKDRPYLELAIDGADQVDPDLNLIKGLGRALLREKIVEIHAETFVVIVDASKLASRLGVGKPLPVEIVPFAAEAHVRWLNTLGCRAELWHEQDGTPVVTDNGNFMARCYFSDGISDPYALAQALAERPGIVEHGLFLDMADKVIVGGPEGTQMLKKAR
jgi:ribose 5-phosphate isomerase A